jgi:hypothetical protein
MDIINNNQLRLYIYKIIQHTKNKKGVEYLFVGDINKTIKTIINKLVSNNKLNKDEEEKLEEIYMNVDLLKKSIEKNREINLVYKTIYEDDNIFFLKNKLVNYINKDLNSEHIYLWYKKSISDYELIDILNDIYNTKRIYNKDEIKEILDNLFHSKINLNKSTYDIKELYDLLKKYNINKVYRPLELNYFNDNNRVFIKYNPIKKIKILEENLNLSGDFIGTKEVEYDTSILLKDKLINSEKVINYITSEDLFEIVLASKNFKTYLSKKDINDIKEKVVFNGYIREYFPNLLNYNDLEKINEINENVINIIENNDKIKNNLLKFNKKKLIEINNYITTLNLKIYPNLLNQNYLEDRYNLEKIFNIFETDSNCPFLIYKTRANNFYKINKKFLKKNDTDVYINDKQLEEWTNTKISKNNNFLVFKIFIKKLNDDSGLFINLLLFSNGQIDIKFNLVSKERTVLINSIKVEDFSKIRENINILIEYLNNDISNKLNLNLYLLKLNDDIFYNSNINYIDFNKFEVYTDIVFNKKIEEVSRIKELFEYAYPYFDFKKSKSKKDNYIKLLYKGLSNYIFLDDVGKFIKNNILMDKDELSVEVKKKFKLSNDNLNKVMENKYFLIKNFLVKNNRYVKSKLNTGTIIELIKKNDNNIQLFTKKNKNIYFNEIINFLITSIIINEKIEKKTLNKDYDNLVQTALENNALLSRLYELESSDIESNNNNTNETNETNESSELLMKGGVNSDNNNSNVDSEFEELMGDISAIATRMNENNEEEQELSEELEGDKKDDDIDINDIVDIIEKVEEEEENREIKEENEKDEEENLLDKLEDEKEEDVKVDSKNMEEIIEEKRKNQEIMKKKYNQYIIKRLKEYDNKLFNFTNKTHPGYNGYGRTCGEIDKKQPIVLNEKEMKNINEKYRDSYTYSIKTGSTKDKVDSFYYICPRIWCPISKISITQDVLNKNNGKCPEPIGEEPLIMDDKKGIWTEIKDGKRVARQRYPYFLKKKLHPEGFEMPCCGKKDKSVGKNARLVTDYKFDKNIEKEGDDEEIMDNEILKDGMYKLKDMTKEDVKERANMNYISNNKNKPIEENKYAILPDKLSNILGNIERCSGLINSETDCFVRKGIKEYNNQKFLSLMVKLINNPKIKNVNSLIDTIEEKMNMLEYIKLNSGNTLKLYINENVSIYNKDEFKEFSKWFLSNKNKEYVKLMGLDKIRKKIEEMKNSKFDFENTDIKRGILREFMIYNSFKHFIYYLRSDNIIKDHEELLELFTNNYEWLNINKYNIILIDIDNINNEETIKLLCSKFIDYKLGTNKLNNFVFVLKILNSYEEIIRVNYKKGIKKEINSFSYFEYPEIQNLVELQNDNCNKTDLYNKNVINLIDLLNDLFLYDDKFLKNKEIKIKKFVINTSFKIVGIVLDEDFNNLFIPLNNNIFSLSNLKNLEEYYELEEVSYMYIQDLVKLKCDVSKKDINKLYDILYNISENELYNNKNMRYINAIEKKNNKNVLSHIEIDNYYYKKEFYRGFEGEDKSKIEKEFSKKFIIPLNIEKRNEDLLEDNIVDEFLFIGKSLNDRSDDYLKTLNDDNSKYIKQLKLIVKDIKMDSGVFKKLLMLKNKMHPYPEDIKLIKIKELTKSIVDKIGDIDINMVLNDLLYRDLDDILDMDNDDVLLNMDELLLSQNDILNNKLEYLRNIINNPFKYVQNSIEDYVYYVPVKINKRIVKFKFLTDTMISIDNKKYVKTFKKYFANSPILDDNYVQDTTEYLISIFSEYGKSYSLKYNKTVIKKKIEEMIKKDYKEDINLFLKNMNSNDIFQNEINKIEKNEINFDDIKEIINKKYYLYQDYELFLLSKIFNVNVILVNVLSKTNKDYINGIKCFSNSNKNMYIMFQVKEMIQNINQSVNKLNKYEIIIQNNNKFFFKKEELSKKIIENIVDEFC